MDQAKRIEIVHDFFRAWETSMSKCRPFLTQDVSWWSPWGTLDISNFDIVAPAVAASITRPIKFTVKGIVAQGDVMAVEAKATTGLKSGAEYDQDYVFMLEFVGEKIKVVKEYLDTQHAAEVWGPALSKFVPGMTA